MADLVERLERLLDNENSAGRIDIGSDLVRGVLAALEAAASKEERLQAALTTALALIEDYLAYRHDGDPWSEDARLMGEMDINYAAKDGRLDAIRALIPEAPVREGWMPIETVPRDGTKVLLFFPSYKEVPVDLYRFDDLGGQEFPWEASDGWSSDVGSEDGPTHWRPLPAPPQDNREG